MVQVYHRPLFQRHYAARFSLAYIFFLLAAGTALVLPFFMAYSASGPEFWLKHRSYPEHPLVKYAYKLILVLEGTKGSGAAPTTMFFSTAASANAAFNQHLRVPVLRTNEVDEDLDGIAERLELTALMPVRNDEAVYSATLMVFFDYKLRKWAKLSMDALAFVQQASPLAGRGLFIDGDLEWRQRWPLSAKGGFKTPYSDDELLDADALLPWKNGGQGAVQADLATILARNRGRNFTTELNTRAALWTGAAPAVPIANGDAGTFNLTATVRFPLQEILYTPGVSEVLFHAWIRYLALLVVVLFVLDLLCAFVFHHQLIETHVHNEAAATVRPGASRFRVKGY